MVFEVASYGFRVELMGGDDRRMGAVINPRVMVLLMDFDLDRRPRQGDPQLFH